MRILHVSSLWPPDVLGGAELYAARLAAEQQAAGHTVGAVTQHLQGGPGEGVVATVPAWPYRLSDFAAQSAGRRLAFRAIDLYNPVASRVLHRAISGFRPDVIHSHSVAGLSATVLAVRRTHIHTLHDYWLLCRRTTLVKANGERCMERCASCRVISAGHSLLIGRHPPDLVVAPSRTIGELHRQLPWMDGRLRYVPHPVDQPPRPAARAGPAGPAGDTDPGGEPAGGPVVFGYIGQLIPPKGIRTLLRAFALLAPGTARLVVAGRGPLEAEVAAAGGGVRAAGWLGGEAKEAFFAEIDCLVVPSEWLENSPLVIAEAHGRGRPVIAADIGSIPELVDAASQPLLFPSGDVDGLVRAMRQFAAHPGSFAPGPTSRATSWSEHVEAITALYDEAIGGR